MANSSAVRSALSRGFNESMAFLISAILIDSKVRFSQEAGTSTLGACAPQDLDRYSQPFLLSWVPDSFFVLLPA
jgi:hypothetical protein